MVFGGGMVVLAFVVIVIAAGLYILTRLHKRVVNRRRAEMAQQAEAERAIQKKELNKALKVSIPEVAFKVEGDSNQETTCSVCLGEYNAGDCLKVLHCKHSFHSSCLDEWLGLHTSCPICRASLTTNDKQEDKNCKVDVSTDGEVLSGLPNNYRYSTAGSSSEGALQEGESGDGLKLSNRSTGMRSYHSQESIQVVVIP